MALCRATYIRGTNECPQYFDEGQGVAAGYVDSRFQSPALVAYDRRKDHRIGLLVRSTALLLLTLRIIARITPRCHTYNVHLFFKCGNIDVLIFGCVSVFYGPD